MILRAYLAGPDVFLSAAREVGARKVAICAAHGLTGCFPLDKDVDASGLSASELGHAIYAANRDLMLSCDLVLANLTPFRGPSADVGTVFELGFFAALGRPCFAYSADPRDFAERTRAALALGPDAAADPDGNTIEPFDLPDNLMLPGAVNASGGGWFARAEPPGPERLAAFTAFEECVAAAARTLSTQTAAA